VEILERAHLERIACGEIPDTPKPGDPAFANVRAQASLVFEKLVP